MDRRDFLGSVGAAGMAASLAAVAAVAEARVSASDKVSVAIMGVNGRGKVLAGLFAALPGVDIPYICEVDLWTGPVPMLPFNRNHFHRTYSWNWHYGAGELGDNGAHWLDICRWALDVDCIRTREQPHADVEAGHISATLCHLGNIAVRTGRNLRFDAKTEIIVGDPEAAKLLTREYRDHWSSKPLRVS